MKVLGSSGLSPGEVALVTTGRPLWRGQLLAQARTTAEVRWVPLMKMASRPNIRLLNAGQRQGLAAQSRAMLLDRGWRKIEIGNALDVRDESMVIYPVSRRTLARSLAAQFGLSRLVPGKDDVLIVLARPRRGAPRCLHEARMIASLLVALSVASARPVQPAPEIGEARKAIAAGRLDQARIMIGRVMASGGSGETVDRALADLAFASGNYPEAIARYHQLLSVHPDDSGDAAKCRDCRAAYRRSQPR